MKSNKSLSYSSSKSSVLNKTGSIKGSTTKLNKEKPLLKPTKNFQNDNSKHLLKESSKSMLKCSSSKSEVKLNLKFFEPKDFNIEEFLKNNTDEIIKCKICTKLLRDPVSCNKCTKLFCVECIQKTLLKGSKCPNCFEIIFLEHMPKFDMTNLEKYTSKEVACPYYGCKENCKVTEMRSHLGYCIFGERFYKKQLVNKVIHDNFESDPCMKTHLLNYLKSINKSLAELKNSQSGKLKTRVLNKTSSNINVEKDKLTLKIDETVFTPKLLDLKGQMNNLNDLISKSIVDLAKTTKVTNENLKSLINS